MKKPYREGLFEREGLTIEWADRDEAGVKTADTSSTDVKGADPFVSHGTLFEQGKADMYNACEWGNYCRVGATAGSRQVGRRAIVTYGAIVVRPESPVYTPQQLAGRSVGVPFYAGTHYLALHMLEGFLPRDQIKICRAPTGSRNRFNLMMKGEIEATTLTEPYITLAEKKGCRTICSAFYFGTEVASDRIDAETYKAFNRAVREAVRRINADKRAYLHYFIDYPKWPPTGSSRKPTRPSTARCARRCAASMPTSAPTCITSSTITRPRTPRSARWRPTTCARVASWCATRRRFRRRNCSAPTIG